jgi:hypothetical protein
MTYERDVREIEAACREVFGVSIEVAPRALQVLVTSFERVCILQNEIELSSDLQCFRRVLASSPAYADAVLTKSNLFKHLIATRESAAKTNVAPRLGNFTRLLTDIFVSRFPFRSGLHPAGVSVKGTGILTETDLILGCLQAGRRSVLPNKTASTLLQAVGLFNDGYPTERSDKFLAKLEAEFKSVKVVDESHAEQQIILYLDAHEHIRLQIFGANALGRIEERLSKVGTFVFRGGVLQPAPSPRLFTAEAIEELEDLMNSKCTLEQQYQRFFERHPEFLKSLDYRNIHAQPILYKDDGSRLIPDFFLEQVDTGWHAIADLKRSHENMVIRKRNRVYFAQWVQEAIAQLQFYREWFESAKNREAFEQTQKLSTRVYRPKMVLIAGRQSDFVDDVERIRLLSAQDANLSLWTYDAVLSRAKKYREYAYDVSPAP